MVKPNVLTRDDFKLQGQVGRLGIATLIRAQEIISERGEYRYLEIGSYLGKSLQPHVQDDDCISALSIDPRPDLTPDERGADLTMYENVTTQDMLDGLAQYATPDQMAKLENWETTSDALRDSPPRYKFDLALIDGEHTITAAFNDFLNALSVMKSNCIILFDDSHIIFPAIQNACAVLHDRGIRHEIRFGGGFIGLLFIGPKGAGWAEKFGPSYQVRERVVANRYRDNMARSHIETHLTRMLRQDEGLRKKAERCLKNMDRRGG